MAGPNSFEDEIWRLVPPEEKFSLMAHAQSKGVLSCGITIIVMATMAAALRMDWLMWLSFICTPFIFQFSAGKTWRSVRPRCLLEYLAARSASRRYAFNLRAKELTPMMIFKGRLEKVFDKDNIQDALEAAVSKTKEASVWIALFGDAVVMISERPGGAGLQFGHLLDDKLEVQGHSPSGNDYDVDREILFSARQKDGSRSRVRLTSRFPAALVAFEKKLYAQQTQVKNELANFGAFVEKVATTAATSVDDDSYTNLFN